MEYLFLLHTQLKFGHFLLVTFIYKNSSRTLELEPWLLAVEEVLPVPALCSDVVVSGAVLFDHLVLRSIFFLWVWMRQ
jgi:hypothetical protein